MQAHARNVDLVDPAALADRYPQLRTDDVAVAAIAHEAGHVDPGNTPHSWPTNSIPTPPSTSELTRQSPSAGRRPSTRPPGPSRSTPSRRGGTGDENNCRRRRRLAGAEGLPCPGARHRPAPRDAPDGLRRDPARLLAPAGRRVVRRRRRPSSRPKRLEPGGRRFVPESALERLHTATALAPEIDRSWAGLCTMATPDRDPLLGEVADDLYVATGWHGHGFMRSPAMVNGSPRRCSAMATIRWPTTTRAGSTATKSST